MTMHSLRADGLAGFHCTLDTTMSKFCIAPGNGHFTWHWGRSALLSRQSNDCFDSIRADWCNSITCMSPRPVIPVPSSTWKPDNDFCQSLHICLSYSCPVTFKCACFSPYSSGFRFISVNTGLYQQPSSTIHSKPRQTRPWSPGLAPVVVVYPSLPAIHPSRLPQNTLVYFAGQAPIAVHSTSILPLSTLFTLDSTL